MGSPVLILVNPILNCRFYRNFKEYLPAKSYCVSETPDCICRRSWLVILVIFLSYHVWDDVMTVPLESSVQWVMACWERFFSSDVLLVTTCIDWGYWQPRSDLFRGQISEPLFPSMQGRSTYYWQWLWVCLLESPTTFVYFPKPGRLMWI